jgi:hypothetical protein
MEKDKKGLFKGHDVGARMGERIVIKKILPRFPKLS